MLPFANSRNSFARWLPMAVIAIIGICYVLISSSLSLMGDDLGYYCNTIEYTGSKIYKYPKYIAVHWLISNGRTQNFIAPLLLHGPGWILWLMNGAMTALMFYMVLKASRLRSAIGRMAMLALLVFTLPWWDMFLLYMVSIGYVWAAALGLVFLEWFFGDDTVPVGKVKFACMLVIAFIAGSIHEALSLPIICGLGFYFIMTRKSLTHRQKWLGVAFVLGVLLTLTSPAIYRRIGHVSDDVAWRLLLITSFYVLALLIFLIYQLLANRTTLFEMCRRTWVVYAVSALASLPIVYVGGIVGRPGFFGQIFALIAFVLWYKQRAGLGNQENCESATSNRTSLLSGTCACLLAVVIILHFIEFTRCELQLGEQTKTALHLFDESKDGAVYLDYTNDQELPWWLLHKTRGVPDDDDIYLAFKITYHLGDSAKTFAVFPEALRNIDLDTLSGDLPVGHGYVTHRILGEEMPKAMGRRLITHRAPGFRPSHAIFDFNAPDTIATPIPGTSPQAYYVTPRDLDPYGSY